MKQGLALGWFVCAFAISLPAQEARYVGAGGCSGSNCHGGTAAASEKDSRIWGNEYAIWSLNDRHSRAFKALDEPRSKRMAEILHISSPRTDARCTVCHAVGSPERSKSDGVACEACHGPAEKWLGPHTQANSHAASVAAGMVDTKNLRTQAAACLGCHLGSKDKVVDHELIAAGHPDLNFELDTFRWAQPVHHREVKPSPGNSLPRVRAWAVGQAAGMAEGMRLLAARAQKSWPEFSELECSQCHHDLRLDSWRIKQGYGNRKPGSLQPNLARLSVLRVLVAQAAPDQKNEVESALNQVASLISTRIQDAAAIAQAAGRAGQQGDALLARFEKQDFTAEQARAIKQALAVEVWRIAFGGVHAAEVATMSLDSLTAATSANSPQAQAAMAPLYDYLEHPSTYQPNDFAALFRKAAGN
jgi:hypothetical protein